MGLGKRSVGIVQFDTTRNRFLAAGDEFAVKFWDMDNVSLLTTTDADGGLPVKFRYNAVPSLPSVSEINFFPYLLPWFWVLGFSLRSL